MKRFLLSLLILFFLNHAHALCVISNGVNLRSGPGPQFAVTWVVPKYTPLVEVSRSRGWYEVEDMDGDKHWVYGKQVTSRMICVAVKLNTVKLRTAPSAQSELADLRQVDRHTPFKRLDTNGEWYEVEASWGESYWIHENTVWRPVKVSKVNF